MQMYFIDDSHPVSSYDEIREAYFTHPKKKKSWNEKKSAESMAKYWFCTEHKELNNLVESIFGDFELDKGYFEYCSKFDESKSGPREHDLCFPYVNAGVHTVSIGIEAKGNESYDKLISGQLDYGKKRRSQGKHTQIFDRIQSMFLAMGEPSERPRKIEDFYNTRYQLFSGLCGTIAEANLRHANTALFIIIQFETEKAIPKSIMRNKDDLIHFLRFLRISNDINSGQVIQVAIDFSEVKDFGINYSTKELDLYLGYLKVKI